MGLPVSLSQPVDSTVTVTWSTGDSNTAPKNSVRGTSQDQPSRARSHTQEHEHEPSSGTVTFKPGQTEATITITILDDEEHEDLEDFLIVLQQVAVSESGYANGQSGDRSRSQTQGSSQVLIGDDSARVQIADNDAPPEFIENDDASRSVVENTPAGTAIGAPITATDADGDTLNYTLSGGDARRIHARQRHRPTPDQAAAGLRVQGDL